MTKIYFVTRKPRICLNEIICDCFNSWRNKFSFDLNYFYSVQQIYKFNSLHFFYKRKILNSHSMSFTD